MVPPNGLVRGRKPWPCVAREDFAMARTSWLLLAMVPFLAACPGRPPGNEANAVAESRAGEGGNGAAGNAQAGGGDAPAGDRLLGSETVTARFLGFEGGHRLSARLGGPGYRGEKRVLVDAAPVAAFLDANRGGTMRLKLDKVSRASAAEPDDPRETLVRIASAQAGRADADAYWQTLPAAQRRCAEASLSGAIAFCSSDDAHRKQGERA
jgi:hypothetical protein